MTNHTTFASRGNETRENERDKYIHTRGCVETIRAGGFAYTIHIHASRTTRQTGAVQYIHRHGYTTQEMEKERGREGETDGATTMVTRGQRKQRRSKWTGWG